MQIVIRSPGANSTEQWTIVELQGDLESSSQEPLGGKPIGHLHYSRQGNPILIIGHHVLTGKVQELDKPLVMINKKVDDCSSAQVEYSVSAIIKRKIVFKTRPKPIVKEVVKK